MVEYRLQLDTIFGSLADPTRRDILQRVATTPLTVGEIAKSYNLTFAAISKHLKVLENAHLITKRKRGKERIVDISPSAFQDASQYLKHYEALWSQRFDALEELIMEDTK
ncbi:MAG TPA: metalloregulator ArsR/SmtB family transcription factor [Candidatus Saccharimonadales bacterium]|nr:metalloregulator ArsR/SmtB family transcription factor [Candidatus Saccharimonadales bacterium]